MVKKLMIPLIAGSAVVVGVAAIAVPTSIVNSQSTNNDGETGGSLTASLRKWNIANTQAIATQSLSISDITNSVIEFLYAKQDEFIKKSCIIIC